MTTRNLEHAIKPKSVVVIGASSAPGSVGGIIFNNIVSAGFAGSVWPVNPKYDEVAGHKCFRDLANVPGIPELAVVATPAPTIPSIIHALRKKGTRAVVVVSAGIEKGSVLHQEMLDAARTDLVRIVGPNTIGLMIPPLRLNASFAHMAPEVGSIALLSQSGAIATSLVDWATDNQIGFSHVLSLGDMADVDTGDFLDLLAGDAGTRAIVMYLETIPAPRKFLSAARAASRLKPVIVVKSGRHAEAAVAAATHTGALAGVDRVVDAAFRRAGVLRVAGLEELFRATETIARFRPIDRARVAIVTNGGGAGVLAVDRLMDLDGELAELSRATIERLDGLLPSNWSRRNPIDIIGDAPPERYRVVLETIAADPGADVLLVMNCPTALASSSEAAKAIVGLARGGFLAGKPLLACWLGEHTARDARRILRAAGVASYDSPSAAAEAVSHLVKWSRAQKALQRVPPASSNIANSDPEKVREIFRHVAQDGRKMLTEPEAKAALAAYGIDVPTTVTALSPVAVGSAADTLLQSTDRVVVKLLSNDITHKSDVGGVVLDLETAGAAEEAASMIERRVKDVVPDAKDIRFSIQPMIRRPSSHELILGMARDPVFGPVIMFGAGGTSVEVVDDTAVALPPLDDLLADDLISRTRVGRVLNGYRDQRPVDLASLRGAMNAVSQMVIDFPCIISIDINPLLADAEGMIALDARIEIDPQELDIRGPNPRLAIRPYPTEWADKLLLEHGSYNVRPIQPADVSLYPDFIARMTSNDIRMRFLGYRKEFPASMLIRMTQLDYDREMAFVALDPLNGQLCGIARLSSDPDHESAEYGIVVRSDLKGQGLGWALLKHLIRYAKADGLTRLEGIIDRENKRMLRMCRELGFTLQPDPASSDLILATLGLSDEIPNGPPPPSEAGGKS